jgi:hypothetical protein
VGERSVAVSIRVKPSGECAGLAHQREAGVHPDALCGVHARCGNPRQRHER